MKKKSINHEWSIGQRNLDMKTMRSFCLGVFVSLTDILTYQVRYIQVVLSYEEYPLERIQVFT